MSKKHRMTFDGFIEVGKLIYSDKEWQDKWSDFKVENENRWVRVTYESLSSPEYWQHKYLNGFVIPQIASAQGEADEEYVVESLKEKFLKKTYESLRDIPARQRSRCRIMIIEKVAIDGELRAEKYYIPSRATLPFEEMKNFILRCEAVRDGLIDWRVLETEKEKIKAMLEARRLAFGEE